MFFRFLVIFFLAAFCAFGQGLEKKYLKNKTYAHHELIAAYNSLAKRFNSVRVDTFGTTDAGLPLHVIKVFNPENRKQKPLKILVMNGIHPGESCGIDASLHWAEKMAQNPKSLGNTEVYIIAVYNVGGSLNRSCCTRANQNGPDNQGFRGNAQNLDLNRDFIKADAKNTKGFHQLFQKIDPDIFMDTHSTNGADYQYSMTLIPYQHEKYPERMRSMSEKWFENVMNETNKNVAAQYYVNVWGKSPRSGFSAFHVSSIYSSGYAGMMGAFAITSEAHMFKPYAQRVEATMSTIDAVLKVSNEMGMKLRAARKSYQNLTTPEFYATDWVLDSSKVRAMHFKGFEEEYFTSELTGATMYRYNREKPVHYKTSFYPSYKAVDSARVPKYYLLHQGQRQAAHRLKKNGVKVSRLKKDTIMVCTVYYVSDLTYSPRPYEGHFPHRNFKLNAKEIHEQFRAGDYVVSLEKSKYFALEALEPSTPGSFFRWNFFDAFLQQKEGFSPYVFEPMAVKFLAENPEIEKEFLAKKQADEKFSANGFAQLYWIYQQMPYYEKEHMRIPVFKVF